MYLNSIQLDIDRDKAFPGRVMGGGGGLFVGLGFLRSRTTFKVGFYEVNYKFVHYSIYRFTCMRMILVYGKTKMSWNVGFKYHCFDKLWSSTSEICRQTDIKYVFIATICSLH